ncbi:MAG TPA: FliH/SctL family protein [Polyangia bacterium]|nr:FliH/SctL family protein [Polyangia bacterium]
MGRVLKALGQREPLQTPPVAAAPPALDEATALFESARRDGFAEGAAQAAGLVSEARAEAQRALDGVAPAAIALARKMAEKIVGHAVELDPGTLADIAAEALGACRADLGAVRLRIHPDDLPALEARRDRLAARLPATTIELVADPAVGRHGCVIDTPRGRIDARLATQLAALERAAGGQESDA